MNGPAAAWPPTPPVPPLPPLPPQPPEPPYVPRTPWQPEPGPPVPPPASVSVVVGAADPLTELLLQHRVVALAGALDDEAVNRAVAELALLDADGDEPVQLRLSGLRVDLGAALTLVDALDLMTAPVHATALGTLTGAAVAVLAVADRRAAGAHALLQLTEPRAPGGALGRDVEALAVEHGRQLRRLQERLAEAAGRDVDRIEADMRAGRLLTVEEAREYGLLDR